MSEKHDRAVCEYVEKGRFGGCRRSTIALFVSM